MYYIHSSATALFTLFASSLLTCQTNSIITCTWRSSLQLQQKCAFTLSLSIKNQEIENEYITNSFLYARILKYLNYDIAQDVYLRLPSRSDSIAAITASYPRQYGSTGRSSVLLVFPVPDKALRHGCYVTFRGDKLDLGTRRFVFTAADIKAARRGQIITK